ncbi:uncharacterized protein LOC113351770 [Papaver somniferum]|uniref:uncharacterized protein LOC113351770 n=1 Tax=Papaver somniferum TaxID=3469 RepID=UPI000E6F90C7|nr:uncharacterized protein LOC113351770 [Papaver somniferum]
MERTKGERVKSTSQDISRIHVKAFIEGEQTQDALIKRKMGIILNFVESSGAEDEPISFSKKARLISMLKNYDNSQKSHIFSASEDDIPVINLLKNKGKNKKNARSN